MKRRDFLKSIPLLSVPALAGTLLTGCETDYEPMNPGAADPVVGWARREAEAVNSYKRAGERFPDIKAITDQFGGHHQAHLKSYNDKLRVWGVPEIGLNSVSAHPGMENAKNVGEAVLLGIALEYQAASLYWTALQIESLPHDFRILYANIYPIEVAHFIQLNTALTLVQNGQLPALTLLIEKGFFINSAFFSGFTPIAIPYP